MVITRDIKYHTVRYVDTYLGRYIDASGFHTQCFNTVADSLLDRLRIVL